jgi:hypothetical protein
MADLRFNINDVFTKMNITKFEFPKYSTQFMNLANQNSK